jgi:RNA polymerase sigma-70 factor (ECF subfamily)
VDDLPDIGARRIPCCDRYLLFNEGYHGSNPAGPGTSVPVRGRAASHRTAAGRQATAHPDVHALAALFCFDAAACRHASTSTVFVPLEDQDRSRWDRARIERGLMHLARSAAGDHMSAGIWSSIL